MFHAHHARCWSALAMLLMACPEPDIPQVQTLLPEVAVAPATVDFGEQAVPVKTDALLYISNSGRATLDMTLALEGADASVFEIDASAATLEVDETLELTVSFLPETFLDYAAELVILSNDEDDPEVRVPVLGTGVAAPLPDIRVSDASIDFGEIPLGGLASEILTITNAGTAPLTLGSITNAGSGSFSLLTAPSQNVVGPGDELPVVIAYQPPLGSDGDSGVLTIPSDDPDEPELEVLLIGNGGADFEYPVAVIDCPSDVGPPTFVRLDGAGSSDPEGFEPLTYEWSLAAVPSDLTGTPISDAYITNTNGDYTELFADAVGVYEVQLIVTNSVGVRSAPDRCVIHAVPEEDILVELTWDTSNADLDLHLAQAGSELFERPGDVNWCNPGPDWGASGPTNNPALDLDDRAGRGPENINIELAADGTYDVRVHYFDDQGDDLVTATVRVYTRGSTTPAFEGFSLMSRNQVWDVARINWPQGTVGTLSTPLYTPNYRSCFNP